MNLHSFDLWVFDLDGTLIDSSFDISNSVNLLRQKINLKPKPIPQISQNIGRGVRHLLANSIPEVVQSENLIQQYREIYNEHLLDNTNFFPGVLFLISRLKQKGKKLAVLTNKPEEFSIRIIRGLTNESFFEPIIGGDSLGALKPDPKGLNHMIEYFSLSRGKILMIGDTDIDIQTANNAGVHSILIGKASCSTKPTFHFSSFSDLNQSILD